MEKSTRTAAVINNIFFCFALDFSLQYGLALLGHSNALKI
jgi:hypothetical protein